MLLSYNCNLLINKYKKIRFFFWKEKEAKLQETKFIMRTIINQQKQLGEVEIASCCKKTGDVQ